MNNPDLPPNMEPTPIGNMDEPLQDVAINVTTYTQQEVKQCAGHINVKRNDTDESWSGQVCAVATFNRFTHPGEKQRYTLLLQTCKHVVTRDLPGNAKEPIYERRDKKLRLRKGYKVRIRMPANKWKWDSSKVQFEFFADDKSQHDIAFIAIELPVDILPPCPTIMPDINNRITGGLSTNFFGIVFRPNRKRMSEHEINSTSLSEADGDILEHLEKTVPGDSGGMLYCHAADPERLVPVCIITQGKGGWDYNHIYGFNQTGALQKRWRSTRKSSSIVTSVLERECSRAL